MQSEILSEPVRDSVFGARVDRAAISRNTSFCRDIRRSFLRRGFMGAMDLEQLKQSGLLKATLLTTLLSLRWQNFLLAPKDLLLRTSRQKVDNHSVLVFSAQSLV
jgi:hypothetical protein